MKKIVVKLVRHGQTIYNKIGKIQGSSDINLSIEGIKQAKDFIINKDELFDIAYCSPLIRSRETLEIISKKLINSPKIEELDLITERGYGIFEGLTEEMIFKKYNNLYEEWKGNENAKIEGSESIEDVIIRVEKFINFIINKNYTNILVVTHSGFLFALFKFINNFDLGKRPDNIKFDNCSQSTLEISYDPNEIKLEFTVIDKTYIYRSSPTKEVISNT